MTMRNTLISLLGLVFIFITSHTAWADSRAVQRTSDGKPNLSGTFNAATLTPLERPLRYEEQVFLTKADVERIAEEERALMKKGNAPSSANREAPAVGGDALVGFEDRRQEAEALGAGNVGGYNVFWFDRGDSAFSIDGKFRTSIITDPANGRRPPMHPKADAAYNEYVTNFMKNDGTAWWLGRKGPGPYDDPELRPPAERCLLGFVGGPPTLPSLYNNYVRIVQTSENIMIMNEMIHDARIVRLGDKHASEAVRSWLGDSIGWWEDDTLVIETTNFRDDTGLDGASGSLKVTERLTALDRDHLQYSFTVDDPNIWTSSWSGDYVWSKSNDHIYEYACHEGNYALGGILRGARVLEADRATKHTESGTE
jgi:hypothetical protein